MNDRIRVVDVKRLKVPKIPRRTTGGWPGRTRGSVVMAGTVYQIEPEEVGVILRFVKYSRTTNPGLHVKRPFVEDMTRVLVQR